MFKSILLATDGSDVSAHAAKMAVDLARTHGATLTALYVIQSYPYAGIGGADPYGAQAYMAALQSLAADAHLSVKKLCTEGGSSVTLETRTIENASAASGVLEMARVQGADLIVMGSHGRSGLARIMLGSVVSRVLAEATLPILIVR